MMEGNQEVDEADKPVALYLFWYGQEGTAQLQDGTPVVKAGRESRSCNANAARAALVRREQELCRSPYAV